MLAKKEKESIKKAVKKEKKNFRSLCKTNNYFAADDKSIIRNMEDLETLCEILPLNEYVALLNVSVLSRTNSNSSMYSYLII